MKSAQRNEIDARFVRAYRLLYAEEQVHFKKEYCERTHMLPQNFSLLERGGASCTVDNIFYLASEFAVSLDWIFFGDGEFHKS